MGGTVKAFSAHYQAASVPLAPEIRQTCNRNNEEWRCGQDAAFALADKIGSNPVECEARDRDRYGREADKQAFMLEKERILVPLSSSHKIEMGPLFQLSPMEAKRAFLEQFEGLTANR
jgi:hypothetical protein